MNDVERAWVVGILEGEGSIFKRRNHTRKDGTDVYYARVNVTMTDKDVIESLLDIVGVGRIIGPIKRSGEWRKNHKELWAWQIDNSQDIVTLLNELYPFMHSRRKEQIDDVMPHLINVKSPSKRKW